MAVVQVEGQRDGSCVRRDRDDDATGRIAPDNTSQKARFVVDAFAEQRRALQHRRLLGHRLRRSGGRAGGRAACLARRRRREQDQQEENDGSTHVNR